MHSNFRDFDMSLKNNNKTLRAFPFTALGSIPGWGTNSPQAQAVWLKEQQQQNQIQ